GQQFLFLLPDRELPYAAGAALKYIYIALGEQVELFCPRPPSLLGAEFLSWHSDLAEATTTAPVPHVCVANSAPLDSSPDEMERRRMLRRGHGGSMAGAEKGGAGQSWEGAALKSKTKQNKRSMDFSNFNGSQRSCKSHLPPTLSALCCNVGLPRRLDGVQRILGPGSRKGHEKALWGPHASLMSICPSSHRTEPAAFNPRVFRCLLLRHSLSPSSLARIASPSPPPLASSARGELPYAMGMAKSVGHRCSSHLVSLCLWRRRRQGCPRRGGFGEDADAPQ
uniref:Uncharacterized protein n=1 Tax=Sus scrofa TaxID=9823 RepID=A0A8D0XLD5_PIG